MGVLKMWEEILDDVGYGDVGPRLQRQALVAPPEAHPLIVVLVSKSFNVESKTTPRMQRYSFMISPTSAAKRPSIT